MSDHGSKLGGDAASDLPSSEMADVATVGSWPLAVLAFASLGWVMLTVLSWVEAIGGRTPADFSSAAGMTCGAITFTVSTWWLLLLQVAGVSGADLVAATTTTRAIAVAWICLLLATLLIGLGGLTGLVDLTGPDRAAYRDTINGLSALVGPVTLIALASNGYTEYRRAFEAAGGTPGMWRKGSEPRRGSGSSE